MHKRNVEEFFSKNTAYWESVYGDQEEMHGLTGDIMVGRKNNVLSMVDRYADTRKLRILDVGCGPGIILEEMVARGHHGTGIDLSREMVNEANARLKKYNAGAEPSCSQGNVESLPFQSESMDVVLCLGVLMYLQDERKAISELSRVLKKGGIAVVVLTNLLKIGNLFDPYYYLCRSWQYVWYHVLNRKKTQLDRVLEPDDFALNKNFAIRRYTMNQVRGMFDRHNLYHVYTAGVEYGPPTFWRKSFLPVKMERKISSCLDRLSRQRGFSWFKMFANQWVICLKKD